MLPSEVWQDCLPLLLVDPVMCHREREESKGQLGAALLITQVVKPPGWYNREAPAAVIVGTKLLKLSIPYVSVQSCWGHPKYTKHFAYPGGKSK